LERRFLTFSRWKRPKSVEDEQTRRPEVKGRVKTTSVARKQRQQVASCGEHRSHLEKEECYLWVLPTTIGNTVFVLPVKKNPCYPYMLPISAQGVKQYIPPKRDQRTKFRTRELNLSTFSNSTLQN